MTTTTKTTITAVAVVILAAIGFQYTKDSNKTDWPDYATDGTPSMSASDDASDEALARDSASLKAQLDALDEDTTRADRGMNDKPISQE
jgi:hypothetical protein